MTDMTNERITPTQQSGEWILTYDVRDDPANTATRIRDTGDGHDRGFVGELDVRLGRDISTPGGWSLESVYMFWYASDPNTSRSSIRTTSIHADSTWITREAPSWIRKYVYAACAEANIDPPYLRCSPWNETCAPECPHTRPPHGLWITRSAAVQEVVNDTPWAEEAQAWLDAYEHGEGR